MASIIKRCTLLAIVALAATQLLIVAGQQTSEQKAKNYANQKLESPLEHKRSRAGELKRIVASESAQLNNKSKTADKTPARLAKQLTVKPTTSAKARLLRSTDKLTSQQQQQSSYNSDSWNDRHSLVPTLSDQEQGDELVALASDNEPQISEQQVKIAPQVAMRPAMTASVAQFMKSYGDKFVRDYDEANGGNKSRPMDEYYTDEDDEEDEAQQQQQQQQQQQAQRARYTMSATQSVAPVDQRQRDAKRTNQSSEMVAVKQQSSDAWTPKISQQQVGGRLVEQLMGSRETVGSSLTKTDMAIEYLRNILKSKQQANNSSSEQESMVAGNYKAPDSSFYPLPIVMSDYANKQTTNKTRQDEAKFSIDDVKQTPPILQYTPTYAPRPLSTDYEDDDTDKKLFTPAASTTFAAELTSTTGRQTVAPSSSPPSPSPAPPTQRPETTEIASLVNGTPLGGDYVEAQDEYLRGQSMAMHQQQQQQRISAQLEAAASEQQAAYHHHRQALPTLSFNPLPPRPLAQPASPAPPAPRSSRFFVMQPIQQQQISENIKPEVKGQKAQESPLVNFKQEVAPAQAAPKVAVQLPSFQAAPVQANRSEQQFKGQPQQIIQQLVQLDEEQKAVTVAQAQAAVKGAKFVQQASRPVVQSPAMISSKQYATADEQQQLHEQQHNQQQHDQHHHQKQQHQEQQQQQQAHYQQRPHPAPHHQANPSGVHHHEQRHEMPTHEQQHHQQRVLPAKQHHLEYTQYTPLEVLPPPQRRPHTPPKIVSYNYFESGPTSESSSHEHHQQQQPTNFQFGDSLLSSTGDVEHVLSSAELEAIQSQFTSAEHPVVPLGDSPVSHHHQQQQQQYNLASLIKSQDLAQRLNSPSAQQQQQQQHDEQEMLKELARNHEDSVSSFVSLQQSATAHSKTRDPMHSAASEQSAQLQSQSQAHKSEAIQKVKQKSLIVYLNHPRADDMSRASSASISDDGLAQLISEQTSGDPFVSAKEFDAQGLSKEAKHLDVSSLRGFNGVGAQEAKELTASQDKDGLSVVVIGDAYKYKKIVLLISSKSGGLKFIPMVKDMRRPLSCIPPGATGQVICTRLC